MPVAVPSVHPHAFGDFVHAAPFALLRLVSKPPAEFHRGVADFFGGAYPGDFSFGVLHRSVVPRGDWFEQVFRSPVGKLRSEVRDGYFLFHEGLVVGHHWGVIRPSNVHIPQPNEEAQRQRVIRFGFHGVGSRAEVVEAARQLTMYFDDIVVRKRGGPVDERRYVHDEPEAARPRSEARPSRPTPAASGGPYEVLGVPSSATDAEVKAAFKEQVKLNHPDKVAHLSAALQAFAEAQVIEITKAYKTIRKVRRG